MKRQILQHKNPWAVELPFNFKVSQLINPRLAMVTFDNRLRQQFKEIAESLNLYGFIIKRDRLLFVHNHLSADTLMCSKTSLLKVACPFLLIGWWLQKRLKLV